MTISISTLTNGFVFTIASPQGTSSVFFPDWDGIKQAFSGIEVRKEEPPATEDSTDKSKRN